MCLWRFSGLGNRTCMRRSCTCCMVFMEMGTFSTSYSAHLIAKIPPLGYIPSPWIYRISMDTFNIHGFSIDILQVLAASLRSP